MQDTCGLSLNLTQLPNSSAPLHIVLWKGTEKEDDRVKSLLDRISVLESMVSGLLESQRSSLWFPSCLRPTPTGIDVLPEDSVRGAETRRQSMGAESDIGTVLSQIVRPTDAEIRSVNVTCRPVETEVEVEEAEAEAEEQEVEEQEAEEQEVEEQEAEEQVEEVEEQAEEQVEEAEEQAEEEVEEQAEEQVEEAEEQAEEEVEAEEAEEIVEYKEIEWKGQTYYVDGQGEVYEMDSDGDLIETPIGVWREATQKLVKYTKATM
jgi:chemotaxis protein histidine kinase CheA